MRLLDERSAASCRSYLYRIAPVEVVLFQVLEGVDGTLDVVEAPYGGDKGNSSIKLALRSRTAGCGCGRRFIGTALFEAKKKFVVGLVFVASTGARLLSSEEIAADERKNAILKFYQQKRGENAGLVPIDTARSMDELEAD